MARRRVFCFPYAGGGASVYRGWGADLPEGVELLAAQLPGREDRLAEPPLEDWDLLVSSTVDALMPHTGLPFGLFGHSMGAVLAFDVARRLQHRGGPTPGCLLLSGRSPFPVPAAGADRLADLPDEDLLARLHERYGSPASNALAHPEVRALALPALRADVRLLEAYRKSEGPLLECPIVALGGEDDASVTPRDLDGWRSETRAAFRARLFTGDHFFLESARSELLAEIARALLPAEAAS